MILEKIKAFFNHSRVKVPTVLQMEATECGAASLAMVLAHYGLWIPLEKLRIECGVNRDGSKASRILRAAKNRGCEAKGYKWEAENMRGAPFPLIIHWEFNHFVVLEGIEGNKAYINDPAMGRRAITWDDFVTSYTGVALLVKPGANFKKAGQRYNVFRTVFDKLCEDKKVVLFITILELCMIIPGLASPIFNQIFLDEILTGKHRDWMGNFCIAMTVSFIITGFLNWLRAVILTRWQQKLTLSDSASFVQHLLKLPMQFFQQRYAAEVAGRAGFNESIAEVLSGSAATAMLDLIVAVFYLALLLQYNVTLTLIGVTFCGINVAIFFFMRRKLTDLNMRIQQDSGKEYGVAMNGLSMIETIKANGNEAEFFNKWAGYRTKVMVASQETQLWSLSVTTLPALLGGIHGALIMTLGGFSIMDGMMTAGMFMAFQNLMGSFQAPVNSLIGLGSTLQTTEMQMQRLDDVRRYEIDPLNFREEKIDNFTSDRLSGEIEIKDLSFGYSPLESPLIENFNMHLAPGRWVALVGSSGSGKSTMARLLSGLYEEWTGEILFDGVNRREIPRSVICGSLSVVDQDVFQMSGTVRENIALFDKAVSRADIIQAAQDACIEETILQMEGGYEAKVAEGGMNFSGGQRQRLEIARALAVNPSILVLDEATSALDPITEQKVLTNIRHRGCSCFIVAHRLSTIRDCDEIIVLERGKIVERGTHRDMIKHDGHYRHLIEEQSKEDELIE